MRGRGKNIFTKGRKANQTSLPTLARQETALSLPEIKTPDFNNKIDEYVKLPELMAREFGWDAKADEASALTNPLEKLSRLQAISGGMHDMFAFSEEEAKRRWFESVEDRLSRFENLAQEQGISKSEIERLITDLSHDFLCHVSDVGMSEELDNKSFSSDEVMRNLAVQMFALDCAWGQEDTVCSAGKQAMHFAADQLLHQSDGRRAPMMNDIKFNTGWKLYQSNKKVLDAWAKVQYEYTQEKLKSNGINSAIVYRLHDKNIPILNPLAASSFNYISISEMATDWMMTEETDVWMMEVPVERIFSTPLTGFGELYQTEVVIMPGRDFNKGAAAKISPYTTWAKEYKTE